MVDPKDPPDRNDLMVSPEEVPDRTDLTVPPEQGRPDRRGHGKEPNRLDDEELQRRTEREREMIRDDQDSPR